MIRSMLAALALAGCAASGPDPSLARLHQAEARFDDLSVKVEQAISVYEMARDTCYPGEACERTVEGLRQRAIGIYNDKLQALREVERAERDLDYAAAEADRRAANRAASSSALIGLGGQLLAPPPRPTVTCTTSNTTMPTTTCY